MNYFLSSLGTLSFWKYALFSIESGRRVLAALGTLFLLLEILDFFGIYPREKHTLGTLAALIVLSGIYTVITRRPVTNVRYKVPSKDLVYEVRIGDLLDCKGEVVISTNTTFDTDVSSGLIAANSVQGQFTLRFFDGNLHDLDRQIKAALKDLPYESAISPGNKKRYPIGTVAKIRAHGQNFYFFAMAELNEHGTAQAPANILDQPLDKLWAYIAKQGELGDLVLPVIGTGRGRIDLPRRKIIEMIAQSFADAARIKKFANKLTIVISPHDARTYGINLFQIRDYLAQNLYP